MQGTTHYHSRPSYDDSKRRASRTRSRSSWSLVSTASIHVFGHWGPARGSSGPVRPMFMKCPSAVPPAPSVPRTCRDGGAWGHFCCKRGRRNVQALLQLFFGSAWRRGIDALVPTPTTQQERYKLNATLTQHTRPADPSATGCVIAARNWRGAAQNRAIGRR